MNNHIERGFLKKYVRSAGLIVLRPEEKAEMRSWLVEGLATSVPVAKISEETAANVTFFTRLFRVIRELVVRT